MILHSKKGLDVYMTGFDVTYVPQRRMKGTSCRMDEECVSNAIKNIKRRKTMLIYKERYKKPYVPIEIAEIQRLLKIDGAEIRCREQGVTENGQGQKVEYLLVLSVPRKEQSHG